MQKISRLKKARALTLAVALGLISSCASQTTDELPSEATSEAALLDESETATPVADESAIFADLNGAPADSEATNAAAEPNAPDVAADSSSPFYNPVGGESLGRVAYTLFGSRQKAAMLVGKNPELQGVKALSADQKVYFDFANVRPMPTFLTKDLLDRYPSELASKLEESSGLGKETITVGPGETLQEVSKRLYGTTRYWTEIYLLNREAIANYDRVPAGAQLSVYQRGSVAVNPNEPVPAPPVMNNEFAREKESAAVAALGNEAPPAPPVEKLSPVDPIPETPDFSAPPQPEEVVTHAPPPRAEPVAAVAAPAPNSFLDLNNSANVRRIVYVALILLIGAVAFFMTRSPKKKNFDMLDVTTSDTGRAKLKGTDSHHQEIG